MNAVNCKNHAYDDRCKRVFYNYTIGYFIRLCACTNVKIPASENITANIDNKGVDKYPVD